MSVEALQAGHIQTSNRMEQVGLWIYTHPTTIKTLRVAVPFFGALLLASSLLGFMKVGVVLTITGGVLSTVFSVALFAHELLVPLHHDMKTHAYSPAKCEGGELYYENDVPILSIASDDPFKAGKAQGYLCGDAISRLSRRFNFMLHTLMKNPRAEELPQLMKELRQVIPADYLREVEGLVSGYNQWVDEQYPWKFAQKLSVDDALLFHLVPDSLHFQPQRDEKASQQQQIAACSAIVNEESDGLTFARNMDWMSLGLAGTYSLVIHRKHTNGLRSTVEVGIPGTVGTLTGMNDRGLCAAMNVCGGETREVQGMPAVFYNRYCLEHFGTVPEVEKFTSEELPLGAYHLTAVDPNQAQSFHFYQSEEGGLVIRRWEKDKPLATLNCRYGPEPCRRSDVHNSFARIREIGHFFANRQGRSLEKVLSLPFVNNWITTHRVLMQPRAGRFSVAFDNAFAGMAPLHSISVERLFNE